MKRFVIIAIAALLSVSAFAAENYVEVSGRAEREITPNEIFLSIVLKENESKASVDINEQKTQMIKALKAAGIDVEKSLKMSDVSAMALKRKNSLKMLSFQLKLSSPAQVLAVYDALDGLNVSQISISKVSHTDLDKFKSEVRKEAMQNARDVASQLAEAVGQSIGACVYINDPNRDVSSRTFNSDIAMCLPQKSAAVEPASASMPIEFKKIELSYSVYAKFELNR
ncbi:MAG: SIMPL domain-containing protein [Alistipes sp.]|nr:SIMPL domain-containing protein [Alistipes sp.]